MCHVYGYTNHSTTMVHTFLESPSNLDVHPGIRFWIFEKTSSELASKYGYVMLTKGSVVSRCNDSCCEVISILNAAHRVCEL